MRTLIIGAGLVGSALKKVLPDAVVGVRYIPNRSKNEVRIDLNDYGCLLQAFGSIRPNIIYLPAALTNVDECEDKETNKTNVTGVSSIVALCESFGAKLVFFSSSYVFDGKSKTPYLTTDLPNPINNYGHQKHMAEQMILCSTANSLIIRTVGVFGEERDKKNFGKSVLARAFQGQEIKAPTDQFMNPILSTELAKIVVRLAEKQRGIFHVAGDTCLSKYDFAMQLTRVFGLESLVVPIKTKELKQMAERPRMGCLDCSGLLGLGLTIPSFTDGLTRFLEMDYYS